MTRRKITDIERLAEQRDRILDEWLRVCSEKERGITAVYLFTEQHAEQMPMGLRRAHDELLLAIDHAVTEAVENSEGESV